MGLSRLRQKVYSVVRLGHLEGRANMANSYEAALDRELAHELHESEEELEWESHEGGAEGEGIMGAIGNVLGGLLGEGEEESHEFESESHELHELHELEDEGEFEWESHEGGAEGEGILGSIGNVLGGLLGEGEEELHEFEEESHESHEFEEEAHESHEFEEESHELHELHEGSHEAGEQFFGRIARGIGRFVKKAAPVLKSIAKVAAPIVGTAIGGPFGAILGKVATSALGEQHELHELHEQHESHEFEAEEEYESHEASHEVAHEIAYHETTQHEALAEVMAEAAALEQHEGEAEAMAGAAVMTTIGPRDRRALRRILPHLVKGIAILTRILRRRRLTRPAVRAIPTIVRRTVNTLKRGAAAGKPITRRAAGRAAATQVRRVLGNPAACTAAIAQNVRANRLLKRRRPGARAIAG
jgi:hypothetical protein